MALDAGIATTLLTFGPYKDATGSLDTSWGATVTLDRELFWPTGSGQYSVLEQIDLKVKSAPDGTGSIRLPQSDQSGFIDAGGSPVAAFAYGITWQTSGYSKRALANVKLTAAMGSVVDADSLHQGTSAPPPGALTSYVNSVTVNGQTYTGNVVLPDAVSGAGTTTVAGITDATAVGQQLLRSADQNAAQVALGVDGIPQQVADLRAQVLALTAQVQNQSTTITALTAAVASKVDVAAVGVSVAPLDAAKKLPLPNLTPNVPLLIGDGTSTVPNRLNTPNVNIFDTKGVVAGGGTRQGGSPAGVDGLDRQWV